MKKRIYNIALWSGVAAILVFSPIAGGGTKIWSVTPVLLTAYAVIFLWIWHANNTDGYKFARSRPDPAIALFAVLAAVSFVFSVYKHASLYALLRLFSYIGIYYLVLNESDHAVRRRLVGLVIGVGGAISAYGVLQYFGLSGHPWWNPAEFLAATFVNHNHFSGYLELVIPVAAMSLFGSLRRADEEKLAYKLYLASALAVMTAAFILAQSRGAWLSLCAAFFVVGAVMILKGARKIKALVISALLAGMMVTLIYFGREIVSERMETMSDLGEEGSSVTRLMIWQGTVGMIRHDPLIGTGIGTYEYAFSPHRPEGLNVKANYAHNDYLEMAAEMGVLAPVIMIWIFLSIIMTGLNREEPSRYTTGCVIGITSLALHGIVDFNFHIPANMILFSVWAAIAVCDAHRKRKRLNA